MAEEGVTNMFTGSWNMFDSGSVSWLMNPIFPLFPSLKCNSTIVIGGLSTTSARQQRIMTAGKEGLVASTYNIVTLITVAEEWLGSTPD